MCSSIDHERQEMKKHADIVRYLSNFSDTKKKKKKKRTRRTWKYLKKRKEEKRRKNELGDIVVCKSKQNLILDNNFHLFYYQFSTDKDKLERSYVNFFYKNGVKYVFFLQN